MSDSLSFGVFALGGIPEIEPGMDLGLVVGDALARSGGLHHGDIVVLSSKIVSKAEGRIVRATDREQAITDQTVRVVATRAFPRGLTRIVENRLGIVGAAAGVDASNTPEGTVLLLPQDPDASASAIRAALVDRFEVAVGVLITDTLGRTWREGQTDIAIGGSGVLLLDDLRGTTDTQGRILDVTAPAVGDELASAADLVKRKSAGLPVAVVRGLGHLVIDDAPGARVMIRPSENDMFRLGTDEAYAEGYRAGRAAARSTDGWTIVIPVKGTDSAKSRLGGPPELATAIALDTVVAALGAGDVVVVTSQSAAPHFAALGARVVIDAGAGLNPAVRQGIGEAGPGPVAVMLGDLPALTSAELVAALEVASGHPRALVADAESAGTVLITALDASRHVPAFGTYSRTNHLLAGYVEIEVPVESGLRRDVDTAQQLAAIPTASLGPRTAAAREKLT